jgi:hypothetical protein
MHGWGSSRALWEKNRSSAERESRLWAVRSPTRNLPMQLVNRRCRFPYPAHAGGIPWFGAQRDPQGRLRMRSSSILIAPRRNAWLLMKKGLCRRDGRGGARGCQWIPWNPNRCLPRRAALGRGGGFISSFSSSGAGDEHDARTCLNRRRRHTGTVRIVDRYHGGPPSPCPGRRICIIRPASALNVYAVGHTGVLSDGMS